MSWQMHEQEFDLILQLAGSHRYSYFVVRVAEWERLWSLASEEGWVHAVDEEGNEIFPIWPRPEFAELFKLDEWANTIPKAIDLSEWLVEWTPRLIAQNNLIAVFPTVASSGIIVSPVQLMQDLKDECERRSRSHPPTP